MDKPWVWGVTLTTTLLASPAIADDVVVTPSIQVEESWTDNALSTSSDRKADFVTSVSPGLSLAAKGARAGFAVDYTLSYDRYVDQTQLSGFRHEGLAQANVEPVEGLLFLDVRGALSEESVSAVGPQAAGDRTTALNRERIGTYSVTPSLRHRFGGALLAQASYSHDQTAYLSTGTDGSAPTPDSTSDGGRLDLRSGEDFSTLSWGGVTEGGRVDSGGEVFRRLSQTVRLEYRLPADLGLRAHGGYDRLRDPVIDGEAVSGGFYGGGLHWVPAKGNEVSVEAGQRYGGLDVEALATWMPGAYTTLRAEHVTSVGTEQEDFIRALDAMERDEAGHFVDPFSGLAAMPTATPFSQSNAVFRQRRSTLAAEYNSERDKATLMASWITRRDLSLSGTGDSSAATLLFALTHTLAEDLSATARLAGDRLMGGDSGKVLRAGLDVDYQLAPQTTARAGWHWVDTLPDQGGAVRENMVSLGGRKSF